MPAAWTTPRNWTAGELVTAAIGNSAWRDNLMYLKDSPTFDGNVTVTGTTLLTGVATLTAAPVFSSATASQAVFTDGSKALVSNAITGTGNVVMSASPTLTGTIAGAAMTLSSTLGVTGATTLSSTVATGALTVTGAATVSTTLGVTGLITSTGGITGGASSHTTGAFSSTVTGGTYNSQTISSAANFTGTVGVAGLTTLSATGDHWNKGSLSLGPAQSSSIGAGDLSVARSATTAYLNFGSNGAVNLALASSVLTLNQATLTVAGFGTSSFSAGGTGGNRLRVTNTTAGTGNFAGFELNNDADRLLELWGLSSTYTTAGPIVASGVVLNAKGVGGLSIQAENASGAIRFYSGGSTLRVTLGADGTLQKHAASNAHGTLSYVNTDGYVAIGGYTSSNSATGYAGFFQNTGSGTGLYISNTAAWQSVSDRRLKTEIVALDSLDTLRNIQPVSYRWNTQVDANILTRRFGFIAQQVQDVEPDLVGISPDGWLSVEYTGLIAPLVHGWQQHDATISQLAARIAALESQDN